MKLIKETAGGILLLQMPAFSDERGSFIKLADLQLDKIRSFEQRQLNCVINKKKFTCRGLHYQQGEFAESKIFRVLKGSIQVVTINIDKRSSYYKHALSESISQPDLALWIPRGFATGYCTLEDETTVLYSSDNDYHPEAEAGMRWDDPCLGNVKIPAYETLIISAKDLAWPDMI
jgi:dTDP-4-dehydrorhamnose 3,5-epimerase